jgi:fructokinase
MPRVTVPRGVRVLGIGELLWDLLPAGPRLGGAPFNATANLARLGHQTRFISAVGNDELGREAMERALLARVDTTWIGTTDAAPTGTVAVTLDASGSPRFAIGSPAAYETIDLSGRDVAAIRTWGPTAICFGTLAQRFPTVYESTRSIIEGTDASIRLYDVNLRDGCWEDALVLRLLALATLVKVNAEEADVVGRLVGAGSAPGILGPALADRFGTKALCVTRGADGAALWVGGAVIEAGGVRVDVVDAVGAGDAFAAALLDGLLRGRPPDEALTRADRLGSIVASRSGALPAWSIDELDAATSRAD